MKKKEKGSEAICLTHSGSLIQFVKAPDKNCISYLRFRDGRGHYLGSLDKNWHKKELKKIQKWINLILKEQDK